MCILLHQTSTGILHPLAQVPHLCKTLSNMHRFEHFFFILNATAVVTPNSHVLCWVSLSKTFSRHWSVSNCILSVTEIHHDVARVSTFLHGSGHGKYFSQVNPSNAFSNITEQMLLMLKWTETIFNYKYTLGKQTNFKAEMIAKWGH